MVFAVNLIEKSPRMDSSSTESDSCSSSSDSTPPVAMDDCHDLADDFILKGDDQSESDECSSNDNGGFDSPAGSLSSLHAPVSETGDVLLCSESDNTAAIDDMTDADNATDSTKVYSNAAVSLPASIKKASPSSSSSLSLPIPHRGSLQRILSPSAFYASLSATPTQTVPSSQSQLAPSAWPMYVINVSTEDLSSQYYTQSNTESIFQSNHNQQLNLARHEWYQLIFDRQQYEFCTRLFALLDTESQSFIGPNCIREFVSLHCPVIKRRDEAIFALCCNEEQRSSSPTFDEIWNRTIHSDARYTSDANTATQSINRIGIEGWMVFCRLLALAHHQESQRRFASRHLQQMMRHKHGGGATRMNPNEVVVVVDNPPPGPPSPITILGLVDAEQERMKSHSDVCIEGWPFCPLPLPELDLDHCLVSTYSNSQKLQTQPRGKVSVEPFSSSKDDFILRFHSKDSSMVVRRSYADFEWLNAILKLHKRQGQGHLCGRIVPPFPSKQGGFCHQKHSILPKDVVQTKSSNREQKDISERAIAAAKSGMGMISSMAKSVWSGYVSGSTPSSSPSSSLSRNKVGQRGKMSSPKWSLSSELDDVPMEVARGIERYLNYLLENNAMSTSFPLRAILQASQSGLESTKQILQDHAKDKKRLRTNLVAATSKDGPHSAASVFSLIVSKTSSSILRLQEDDDKPWIRAAAQVAMALQFHGILETTGHETTSAKIQHASLPKFRNHPVGSWDDEEPNNREGKTNSISHHHLGAHGSDSPKSETSFEAGVINVESELADEQDLGGYDMLPSPGPSEEHRVLNAGSAVPGKAIPATKLQPNRSRFVYETTVKQSDGIHDKKDAVLGSIRVENDIDKLRDIIRSINHTMGKLYQSSTLVRSAQGTRNMIQLSLLRDVDSWGDAGDELISQRALVDGVAALESFNNDVEDSNKIMTDDILWQASLATSAVGAVTEVRDAVRASNTASRAKRAAFMAAEKAKKAYESCDLSSSKEKIEHTRSEASTAQSHAIHATVVEYEANIAKKNSAVSLAQDVKSWNIHRKRELLRTCVQVAKSQQEACGKAADAWESLRDGLISSSSCSFQNNQVNLWPSLANSTHVHPAPTMNTRSNKVSQRSSDPITAFSYTNTQNAWASDELDSSGWSVNNSSGIKSVEKSSSTLHEWESGQQDFSESIPEASNDMPNVDESADLCSLKESQQSELEGSSDQVYHLAAPNISHLDEDYFSLHQGIIAGESSYSGSDNSDSEHHHATSIHDSFHSGHGAEPGDDSPRGDAMSTSMQSLIDGLMKWGEDEGQRNNGEMYQTDDILSGTDDFQQNNLLD